MKMNRFFTFDTDKIYYFTKKDNKKIDIPKGNANPIDNVSFNKK